MPFLKRTSRYVTEWLLDNLHPDVSFVLFILTGAAIFITPFIAGCTLILWLLGYSFPAALIAVCLTVFGVPLYFAFVGFLGSGGKSC